MARATHEKIAGSKLVILPKSGHMTFVDQPVIFEKAVEDLLGK
ncbi:MAG: alpha/beta hydrolase [Terriglobales bacterium]